MSVRKARQQSASGALTPGRHAGVFWLCLGPIWSIGVDAARPSSGGTAQPCWLFSTQRFHLGLAGLTFALITGFAIIASFTADRRQLDVFGINNSLLGGGNRRLGGSKSFTLTSSFFFKLVAVCLSINGF